MQYGHFGSLVIWTVQIVLSYKIYLIFILISSLCVINVIIESEEHSLSFPRVVLDSKLDHIRAEQIVVLSLPLLSPSG